MCIDFFGRYQSQAVGGTRVGFTAPMEATVVNPDPVAVLRGAPHAELATRFVEFLLTREGQRLWNLRPGDEEGPAMYELRRLPARREMYDLPAARLVDKARPYEEAQALPPGTPSYFAVVPTVLHAMAIDVHEELQAAWLAILAEPEGPERDAMVEAFEALPFTADELQAAAKAWKTDPDRRDADRLAWTRFFLKRYEEVVRVGRS